MAWKKSKQEVSTSAVEEMFRMGEEQEGVDV